VTRRRPLSALAFGLTLAGFAGGTPASAGTPSNLLRPTLVLGATLPSEAGVKAGPGGAEWALPGNVRVVAGAGSELRVIAVPQQLDLGARRRVASYTVVLRSGMVRAHVPTGGTTAVVISAPRKTSVIVASGEAAVAAGAQVAVANREGQTSVGVVGQPFHAVDAGMVEVLGLPKRPLVATPSLAATPSVLLSYGGAVALGALDWDAVPGARSYRVELRDARSDRVVTRTETDATELPAGLAELEPGAYSLRLTAVDEVGFESVRPVTRAVRVLAVKLPVGGFVDAAGVVRFPPGVTIDFERVEGIQMAYGLEGPFAPAPASLSLFRSQPSLVRFRAAGAESVRELWLAPRAVHAKVEFGPRAPRWPGAPLEIQVRVDGAGESLDWLELKPKVSIGIEPVAVEFRREGQTLRGVVPSRKGKGPWVVRVEVEDQHGIALGRDFIEVAASARDSEARGGS
jgi:hypothetical protein